MDEQHEKKVHRPRKAGPKALKKKAKSGHEQELTAQQRNPKAYSVQHARKALKIVQRWVSEKMIFYFLKQSECV